MIKMNKSTVYFVLFFLINIAVGLLSYWMEDNMITIIKNYDLYWNVLFVICLVTWCVALIKVKNSMHQRICSYYFLLLIVNRILYYFAYFNPVLKGISYLLYPIEVGFQNVLLVLNNWGYYNFSYLFIGIILILFYVAFYFKYQHSLSNKQNNKYLLAAEMFSIFIIYFERCNIKISNNINIFITIAVVVVWLFCIFYFRKNRNVLFRIMVIWLSLFLLIIIKYLVDVFFESIFPEFREMLTELYVSFYSLFPGAMILGEPNNETYWSWAIAVCVFVITFYAVFSNIKIRISNKEE